MQRCDRSRPGVPPLAAIRGEQGCEGPPSLPLTERRCPPRAIDTSRLSASRTSHAPLPSASSRAPGGGRRAPAGRPADNTAAVVVQQIPRQDTAPRWCQGEAPNSCQWWQALAPLPALATALGRPSQDRCQGAQRQQRPGSSRPVPAPTPRPRRTRTVRTGQEVSQCGTAAGCDGGPVGLSQCMYTVHIRSPQSRGMRARHSPDARARPPGPPRAPRGGSPDASGSSAWKREKPLPQRCG